MVADIETLTTLLFIKSTIAPPERENKNAEIERNRQGNCKKCDGEKNSQIKADLW